MRRIKAAITKRRVAGMALWLCWTLLFFAALWNVGQLAKTYPTASLRYDVPIADTASTAARRYSAANEETAPFWPTFWAEEREIAVEGLHTATARSLWFSGDGALVWPTTFMQGGYPGPLDEDGCCVSDTLAWQLWGYEDVTGYDVVIGKQSYIVRGVFIDNDAVVLVGTGEAAYTNGWQAAELNGTPDGELRTAALDFAQASGLGMPTTLVDGPAIAAIGRLICFLPLVVMGIALLVQLFRFLVKLFPSRKWVIGFVAMLLFAWVLPTLLEELPSNMIPTRFSDFAFWGRLFTGFWDDTKEWLLLNPAHKDMVAKLNLAAQVGIFIAQAVCSVLLIRFHFAGKRGVPDGKYIYTEGEQNLPRQCESRG